MAYRLALDVGTASCGLIAWKLDESGALAKLAYDSLDIWQEPLLPAKAGGVGEPKKAARRAARMMRRGIYRRARRLRKIAYLSSLLGLDCLATQFPWARFSRICVSPLRVRRLASTVHPVASIRPASAWLPWPSPATSVV